VAERVHQPLAFDAACALAYGSVAASLHRAGHKSTARAFDTMIAATAIAYGLPLYTCNGRDFVGIDGLDLRVMAHPRQGPAAS
jgi:tRNA(fMet)-specific endonuclease VapC